MDQRTVPRVLINARFHDQLYDQCALHSNLEGDVHKVVDDVHKEVDDVLHANELEDPP